MNSQLPAERIEKSILLIRDQKVMLDFDLAELYGVETKVLVQAVKRNIARFPDDFMFQHSKPEFENWRSHFVTSNPGSKMGLRRPPYAFTEQGVAMLSSVLRSKRAVEVNIEIMRVFVRLRAFTASHDAIARKLDDIEGRLDGHRHANSPRVVAMSQRRFEIIDRQMADVLRTKAEVERLQIAWDMWRSARRMIARIVSHEFPSASEAERSREIAERLSGRTRR